MSYNGSGVYTLPGAQLATGATVSATENNQFRNDVAAALNTAWTRDGQAPATNDIPMGSNKFTGLAAGTTAGDSVRYEQLPSPTNLLAVANGGTGAGTAGDARTNLGVAIGTDVQAYSATLNSYSTNNPTFRNRIINGAMMIDQRNSGSSITLTTNEIYTLDRWKAIISQSSKFSAQQSSSAPVGFTKSLVITSLSSYSVLSTDSFNIQQNIEGVNCIDFGFGTANASNITVSFWVKSSLTGSFGGSIVNNDGTRSYPFSYTISSANTWEQKSVIISGDISGTWNTSNETGIAVRFSLGCGSNFNGTVNTWASANYVQPSGATSVVGTSGATFYITGVQLEKGSVATPFEVRSYGTEVALCERYYFQITSSNPGTGFPWDSVYTGAIGVALSTTDCRSIMPTPVTLRATPSIASSNAYIFGGVPNASFAVTPAISTVTTNNIRLSLGATGLTQGSTYLLGFSGSADGYLKISAEL
jgi:hypothetical protein